MLTEHNVNTNLAEQSRAEQSRAEQSRAEQSNILRTLGTSTHAIEEREINDYYATHPSAVEELLKVETFSDVLEPACGEGHISKVLISHGLNVTSQDLIDRGYGEIGDFFELKEWRGDIITNPPFKLAQDFIEHALDIVEEGSKVAMFLKLQFLESQSRKSLFDRKDLRVVYIPRKRLICAKGGDFERFKSSAVCYAWFVFEKGYKKDPNIKWIN